MDAIAGGDPEALKGELGDLLFHVVIHSQLASEAGTFDLAQVARASSDKLMRRHPHVFGTTELPGDPSKTVLEQWERIKRDERKDAGKEQASLLDGLPRDLPALYTAARALERAARVGIVPARVDLPLDVDDAEALGDLLFDLAALAREQGMDAEGALRQANLRFADRVRRVEDRARAEERELASYTPDELRAMWEAAAGGSA